MLNMGFFYFPTIYNKKKIMALISKYFEDFELVGPEFIKTNLPVKWFIDKELLSVLDALREEFGPITINNWKSGGQYKESGLRMPNTGTGASFSQHKFGKAADLKFKNHTVQDVYKAILANEAKWVAKGLTTLENITATPSWLHIDVRNTGSDKILIVNP